MKKLKKSRAVIDRPYSLGYAIVGALYERPGFFVQSRLSPNSASVNL
jgi:hypothetical protein